MNKILILNELKSYKNFKSDTEFAKYIGITQQNLYNWYKRAAYDIERLSESFPEVSAEYLLRGTPPMLKSDLKTQDETSIRAKYEELEKRYNDLLNTLLAK